MNNELHFSTGKNTWTTPIKTFNELNLEFNFTLDPCCLPESALCQKYYTPKEDGLIHDWSGEVAFVNPPYSRDLLPKFIEKCWYEWHYHNVTSVMLIPAKTETVAFHKYIIGNAEIRFIKGRLKFGGCENNAPFPSIIVVFKAKLNLDKKE